MALVDASFNASVPWRSGLRGARANLLPGLILQLLALGLVLGYYHSAWAYQQLSELVAFRQRTGYAYGIVSTGLVAGVLPFLYLHFGPRDESGKRRFSWAQGAGLTCFWAYKGLEVDLWYRLQAHLVGTGHDAGTIAIKVVLDQFVYCPILAIPVTAVVYEMVELGLSPDGWWADLRAPGWYRRRTLPVLISNLGVWIPAVAIIYLLPTPLQLPLQNIVLCFYTLIVAHQTRRRPVPAPAAALA